MHGRAVALLIVLAASLITWGQQAHAWQENHVLGDEVRIELDPSGKAIIQHRVTFKTNGNVRFRRYEVVGVDPDAVPLPNCYAVPARDAVSSSLESATPLKLPLHQPRRPKNSETDPPAVLKLEVDSRHGLRRGTYVLVFRYQTDLRGRGLVKRDGAMVRVDWHGPIWDDGFDKARTTFIVPSAPTPPRAVERPHGEDEEASLTALYLSEVRRGSEQDEVELLRAYAQKSASVPWAIRVDQRALDPLPRATTSDQPASVEQPAARAHPQDQRLLLGIGGGLWLLFTLLVGLKGREVRINAERAKATMPALIPLPVWLRAPLAGVALVAGVGCQLLLEQPIWGACSIVAAALLVVHRAAQVPRVSTLRGPGRWLSVSEDEALGPVPPLRGAVLDVSTRLGKLLLLLLLSLLAALVVWMSATKPQHAALLGLDSVVLLALFGTGGLRGLPPDMAVEPARFLRKLVAALRKKKGVGQLRMVPRIRMPNGEVDPDELRLAIVPRMPLRGFTAIEVGLTYALGLGARVAMPEVLLRFVQGSPCEEAIAAISGCARITPGRKPDERVLSFSPRLPTVKMTLEIAAALAARVVDRQALSAAPQEPEGDEPGAVETESKRQARAA